MSLSQREYVAKLCRVANAAKTLEFVLETPDRPVQWHDIVLTELKAALKDLDSWDGFDPRASLEYYRNKKG